MLALGTKLGYYAYVKYKDGACEILLASQIKRFNPSSIDDFDKNDVKLAYWRSPKGEENYYPASILLIEGEFPCFACTAGHSFESAVCFSLLNCIVGNVRFLTAHVVKEFFMSCV